jgi:hypothetical protein
MPNKLWREVTCQTFGGVPLGKKAACLIMLPEMEPSIVQTAIWANANIFVLLPQNQYDLAPLQGEK